MNTRSFLKNSILALSCVAMLATPACNTWNSMSQSGQGAAAGGAAGAAIGTGIGALIGGGRGTWIGALVGGALGAGTGALIGNSMDRQKKALEEQLSQMQAQENANSQQIDSLKNSIKIESVKDSNNLQAIKLVMGDAVLFSTNSHTLTPAAQATLSRVAYNLEQFPESDVTVVGFTDNTGTDQINNRLSLQRAQSVVDCLENDGVAASRLKAIGDGSANPVASNSTAAGRAQNRRVEIYITASKQMIENAQSSR